MFSVFNRCGQNILKTQAIAFQSIRFATKKAGGSTKNGRDSPGQRLGLKKFGGEYVISGNIIVRQRGRTYRPGENTKLGRDFTLYAVKPGYVKFTLDQRSKRQVISIVSENPNPGPYVKKEKYVPGRNTPISAFKIAEMTNA